VVSHHKDKSWAVHQSPGREGPPAELGAVALTVHLQASPPFSLDHQALTEGRTSWMGFKVQIEKKKITAL
jgi:hypothetical protein